MIKPQIKREVVKIKTLDHDVTLSVIIASDGFQEFIVQYGKEKLTHLNYSQACKQFGACVLHSAQCMGLLDR
ncbi:MAG: hypothetical protein GY941_21790 [Planctomycetes bacterium]|nr:hypothetical protein [Planctomycetota bacterium]